MTQFLELSFSHMYLDLETKKLMFGNADRYTHNSPKQVLLSPDRKADRNSDGNCSALAKHYGRKN
jgi:hypothetical protein